MPRRTDLSAVPLLGRTIAPEGSGLVLAEWEAAGRTTDEVAWQAPLHVHHTEDEAWYVLSGTLRLNIDGEFYDVPAGSGIVGPQGVPHTFGNPSEEPARYVLVMSATTQAMLAELHGGFSGDVAALFEKYGATLLG
ncbi:cupin domain-containing protein [Kribbella solani]|uniref:Mannose-6-phosphate isomerase-like protein (Cupin superfamily) n=1 Tax=Kribbella solani TaxID=236067 RepID=A0A841DYZ7_9ACTN|nr:cupin domain-containing protein [Kribbella solani]MBB5980448.1 mannose-6-phosphate isomerase-like protein (cupin superfamily) [Kribbella solani]MDX3004386.1 cupin domain-containing protein [Kribbella solani]